MIDMINTKTINDLKMSGLIELSSVRSLLDTDIGCIYPQNEDGTPDLGCEISLYDDEVSSEWIESLSYHDYNVCKPFLNL